MKIPWATATVFVTSVAAIVILIVTGHISSELVPVLVAILPSVLGTSWLTERVAKQTSNGHMKSSVKEGLTELAQEAPEVIGQVAKSMEQKDVPNG